MSQVHSGPLVFVDGGLSASDGTVGFTLAIGRFDGLGSLPPPEPFLQPEERRLLGRAAHERRRATFLAGRWAAKHALARQAGLGDAASVCIGSGVFSQPVVLHPPGTLHVSIAHTPDLAAALAFPGSHPMGVDVEPWDPGARTILEDQLTDGEKAFVDHGPWPPAQGAILLWAAKEALSKALGTGLTTPFPVLETQDWDSTGGVLACSFVRFAQYRVWVYSGDREALAVCYPSVCHLRLGTEAVAQALR